MWQIVQIFAASSAPLEWDPDNLPPVGVAEAKLYFGVYYHGQKIGFTEQTRSPLDDGGAVFVDRAFWRFVTQGREQRLVMDSETEIDANWTLRRLNARIDAGIAKISANAWVEKQGQGEVLQVEIHTGGRVQKQQIPITGQLLVPGLLRAFVAAQNPQAGSHYSLKTFNPLLRSVDEIGVLVEGRTDQGWRITEIAQGSLKTQAEIDQQGNTLVEDSALGFRLQREAKEQALKLDSGSLPPDLILASAVRASGPLPANPRLTQKLRLNIKGVDVSAYPALQGGRQVIEAEQLQVVVADWPAPGVSRLPEHPANIDPSLSPELQKALRATALVQSDDPSLVAQAQHIIGDVEDPAQAALRLTAWVYREVEKVNNVGIPSAVEVLHNLRGDCNEHTVLLTALARAVGIPARMAAGLVLADLHGTGAAFYYHAWVELWLDGAWHAVDPTFGQAPADATHLRFVVGGLQNQVNLVALIGALNLQVVESHGGLPSVLGADNDEVSHD